MGKLYTGEFKFPDGLTFEVTSASYLAQGGCDRAAITVKGSHLSIVRLLEYIGYGIDLIDEHGDWRWGGVINVVRITRNGKTSGLTLDEMSNSVAIQYQHGSDSQTTDYLSDADSIARYGFTKQRLENLSKICSVTEAEHIRAMRLAQHKKPMAIPAEQGGSEDGATLECIGLFHTLEWTYIKQSDVLEKNTQNAEAPGFDWMKNRLHVHDDNALYPGFAKLPFITQVAQKFTATQSFFVQGMTMYIGGVGPPLGGLKLSLWTTYPWSGGAKLCESAAFVTGVADFVIAAPVSGTNIIAGTDYWIVAECQSPYRGSGDFWVFGVDPTLSNSAYYYDLDLSQWYAVAGLSPFTGWTNFNFLFRLYGGIEHAQQIANIVTTAYATNPLLVGADISNSSGLSETPQIINPVQVSERVKQLLEAGTTNYRRLLARVTPQRTLKIYEEPSSDYNNAPLHLRGNRLVDRIGNPIRADPCGQWCIDDDLGYPAEAEPNPAFFCVDTAEWTPDGDWRLTARGVVDPIRALRQIENK